MSKTINTAQSRAASSERLKRQWGNPDWLERRRAGIAAAAASGAFSRGKSEAMKRLWANPTTREARVKSLRQALDNGAREKLRATMLALKSNPDFEARRSHLAAIGKRGFYVPPHLMAEYKTLRLSKRLTAEEAGSLLGLLGNAKVYAPDHFFDKPATRGRPPKYRVKHLRVGHSVFFDNTPARKVRASIRQHAPMKFKTETVLKAGKKQTKVTRIK